MRQTTMNAVTFGIKGFSNKYMLTAINAARLIKNSDLDFDKMYVFLQYCDVIYAIVTDSMGLMKVSFSFPRFMKSTFQGVLYLHDAWMDFQSDAGSVTFTDL